MKNNKVLAIIPARDGSKRLPNKNLSKIHGKTLIEHCIDICIQSIYIDKVVFYSDSIDMQEIVRNKYPNVELPHRENVNDKEDILESVKELLNQYPEYNTIVILQVDHPAKTVYLLNKCILKLIDSNSEDLITVKNGFRTGNIRVMSRESLLRGTPTSHIIIVPDDDYYIDIHTKEDLEKARKTIPKYYMEE